MFRSPTCTAVDKEIGKKLAELAEINVEEFAQQMFEAGSNFANKTEEEILNQDFKIFYAGSNSFGVSQISAMSKTELEKVEGRITPCLEKMRVDKNLNMIYVMLTDILNESTYLIYDGESAANVAASAFGKAESEDGLVLKGVVSRKKQLIPQLISVLAER